MFSNKHFDPVAGSRLYNEYLEHYMLAEEVGFDGIMLNEHHNAPFCMQAKANIFAAILAAMTKKVKIVMLGNPLPLGGEPGPAGRRAGDDRHDLQGPAGLGLRARRRAGAARHRRQPGLQPRALRGGARPDRPRPGRSPGPFRWEGTHYQHRVVNPWAVPLQKPYPRVWIPGVISKETIVWAAQQRYPYIALNTSIEQTKKIWELYDEAAAEAGFTAGPDYHGLLKQIHVADTEEKAIENARQFRWMQGEFTGLAHPVWSTPSGYGSPETAAPSSSSPPAAPSIRAHRPRSKSRWPDLRIIAGTPKQVIAKLRILSRRRGPASWRSGAMTARSARKTRSPASG